jgi:16S rRNA (adenine1518-N6/adenine1519-N6)-dimethyltransferase
LDVIEIDRDLARALRSDARARDGLRVHVEDALDTDFSRLRDGGPALRVVGNLPYNISTPVLFHLLAQRGEIRDMHFMLQKEVVDRMAAAHGGKDYGRLTVMLAAYAEVERLFDVGPGAFQPPPKVWSAIVRLRPSAAARFAIGSERALKALVTAAFSHRRKILRNGLKGLLSDHDIRSCGVDPLARPETLSPEQFGCLAARYCQLERESDSQSL